MARVEGGRGVWRGLLAAIVCAVLLSRAAHTGIRLLDKYLGDALYAAMVYVPFRLTGRIAHVTAWAAVTMAAIECSQLAYAVGIGVLPFSIVRYGGDAPLGSRR